MRRAIAIGLAALPLLVVACGAPVTSPTASTDASPIASSSAPAVSSSVAEASPSAPEVSPNPPDFSSYFAIDEIGLGPDGYVTLLNYTDTAASLDSAFLCQQAGCVDVPDVEVRPGEVARIAVGDGTGIEAVAMTGADLELTPSDGEVALFASQDTSDPTSMRSYLQWGSTPHALTAVAVEAGLWSETAYAPSAPDATRLWRTDANLWVWDPGQ